MAQFMMVLQEKVLLKKVAKFESRELQKTVVNQEQLLKLGQLLSDEYVVRRPRPSEYVHRKELVRVFNQITKELYGYCADCPVVEEYGSSTMDLFTTGSDLDLSINFSNSPLVYPRNQQIKTLRRFAKKFYELQNGGIFCGVEPIFNAKVPVLKVVHVGTGIECDLTVENRDGIMKSSIIYLISSIDERFQQLCLLMKGWAKGHDINSSKDGTLSSLSIILLVAFHLQTRDPPILPPFSAILKDGEDIETVKRSIKNFENYGRRNTESLGELFISFLIKLLSVEELWAEGLCASPYQGRWISKILDTKIACINVEDFRDHTENVARAVGKTEVSKIYNCIKVSIEALISFMNGEIGISKLKQSLFGNGDVKKTIVREVRHAPIEPKPKVESVTIKKAKERKEHVMTTNPLLTMKKVLTPNGWENIATQNWTTIRPPGPHGQAMSSNQAVVPSPEDLQPRVMPVDHWGPVGWRPSPVGPPVRTWGGTLGVGHYVDHLRRSQVMPPMEDPWETQLQQYPTGRSLFSYGQPFGGSYS